VERYRSQEQLTTDFAALLNLTDERFKREAVTGVGEAAVAYVGGPSRTIWFRRGSFRVWISPLASGQTWEGDPALQHLAKAIDRQIAAEGPAGGGAGSKSGNSETSR